MSRRTPRAEHKWAKHPTLLTNISSVSDLLLKLDWNLERFQQEVERRPCDSDGVAYAAIDYCVTSVALRDWFAIDDIHFGTCIIETGIDDFAGTCGDVDKASRACRDVAANAKF